MFPKTPQARQGKAQPGMAAVRERVGTLRALPAAAVLPFLDLRPEGADGHVGEGLAEEVLQALNRVEGLRVVSRTTSFPHGGSGLPLGEIGRRLQADVVLGGTLVAQGGTLTLSAELVDVGTDRTLISESFDFDRKDLFATLDSLAAQVATALGLTPPARRCQPVDLDAYLFYLRGRQQYFRYSRQGMVEGEGLFRKALALAPDFARAWAGLADCAAFTCIYLDRSEARRCLAEDCSRRALELDPDLPEAHASRGVALSAAGQVDEADEAFERALLLDPQNFEASYFFARHCFAAGRPEMAIQFFEWASSLRPEDYQSVLLVAQVYHSLGVDDEAAAARRRGLALVEQRLADHPGDARARYLGANALVALGERDKGLAWAREARALDPADPMLLYNLGCIHTLAGDTDEALDCLGAALEAGLSQKDWLLHDGDLDPLRGHPRFEELVASLGTRP